MPSNSILRKRKQQERVLFLFIAGALVGGLVCGYYATLHIRSYLRMGDAPQQLTSAEVLQIPLDAGAHWVHLKDKLQLDCQNALQQLSNGSVEFTEYTGHDETGHTFFLQYKGNADCNAASALPVEGLLKDPPIYWWTKNSMPAPSSQSAEIRVGYLPSEELWEGLAAAAVAVMLLGILAAVAFKTKKQKATAAQAGVYQGITVPKGL